MGPVPPNSAVPATTEATHALPTANMAPDLCQRSPTVKNMSHALARAPGGVRRYDYIRFIPVLSSIFPRKEIAALGCTGCINHWAP